MSSYTLTIDGVDRTTCIGNRSITIADETGSFASTMSFSMVIRDGGDIPEGDQEVIVI